MPSGFTKKSDRQLRQADYNRLQPHIHRMVKLSYIWPFFGITSYTGKNYRTNTIIIVHLTTLLLMCHLLSSPHTLFISLSPPLHLLSTSALCEPGSHLYCFIPSSPPTTDLNHRRCFMIPLITAHCKSLPVRLTICSECWFLSTALTLNLTTFE